MCGPRGGVCDVADVMRDSHAQGVTFFQPSQTQLTISIAKFAATRDVQIGLLYAVFDPRAGDTLDTRGGGRGGGGLAATMKRVGERVFDEYTVSRKLTR